MSKIYVIPKAGLMVPDPSVRGRKKSSEVRLPEGGKLVEDSNYWQRRLRDGDVSLGSQPAPAATEPKPIAPLLDQHQEAKAGRLGKSTSVGDRAVKAGE